MVSKNWWLEKEFPNFSTKPQKNNALWADKKTDTKINSVKKKSTVVLTVIFEVGAWLDDESRQLYIFFPRP